MKILLYNCLKSELKIRLPEIQEYLNSIGFKIDKLYDTTNKFGFYNFDKEIKNIYNPDDKKGIYIELKKVETSIN